MVRAVKALTRLGGVATSQQLKLAGVHWRHVDAALEVGAIVRTARGHFVLPTVEAGRSAAHRLSGAASHITAALHWGWKVKTAPKQPHVTVRAKRSLPANAADGVIVHWRDLQADEVAKGWVTTRARTVVDCCLDLPFDEALSVFDSARRSGLKVAEVLDLAAWLTPRQVTRVSRVAAASESRADNPFESTLRSIASGVGGLRVKPQVRVRYDDFYARVDLADEGLKIVLEADSHEFHTGRSNFDRDCRRYNGLVVRDWIVLRFTWEQVMFEPAVVHAAIAAAVALRRSQGRYRLRSGQLAGTKRPKAPRAV